MPKYRVWQEAWETTMNAFMPYDLDDPRYDNLMRILEQIEKPFIRDDNPDGTQLEFDSREQFVSLVSYEVRMMEQHVRIHNEI